MVAVYYGVQGLTIVCQISRWIFSQDYLKERVWITLYEHHIWQLVFSLVLVRIFSGGRYSEWGLNFRNSGLSLRIFAWFVPICLAILFLVNLPSILQHSSPKLDYPLTFANMSGWLSFEALLPGPSEELLFRGLIHTYLFRSWKGIWKLGRLEIPTAGILTTLIFCLAHVSLFKAPHVSWTQQAFAFGLGIYYSAVYHRTESLLNPVLAHNFWDVIAVASWYLLSWRFH